MQSVLELLLQMVFHPDLVRSLQTAVVGGRAVLVDSENWRLELSVLVPVWGSNELVKLIFCSWNVKIAQDFFEKFTFLPPKLR